MFLSFRFKQNFYFQQKRKSKAYLEKEDYSTDMINTGEYKIGVFICRRSFPWDYENILIFVIHKIMLDFRNNFFVIVHIKMINMYIFFRWITFLSISLAIVFVVLLTFLSLISGALGASPSDTPSTRSDISNCAGNSLMW